MAPGVGDGVARVGDVVADGVGDVIAADDEANGSAVTPPPHPVRPITSDSPTTEAWRLSLVMSCPRGGLPAAQAGGGHETKMPITRRRFGISIGLTDGIRQRRGDRRLLRRNGGTNAYIGGSKAASGCETVSQIP